MSKNEHFAAGPIPAKNDLLYYTIAKNDLLYYSININLDCEQEEVEPNHDIYLPIDGVDEEVTSVIESRKALAAPFCSLPLLASFFSEGDCSDNTGWLQGTWLKTGKTSAIMLNPNDQSNCYCLAQGAIKKRIPKNHMVIPFGTFIQVKPVVQKCSLVLEIEEDEEDEQDEEI